MPFIKNNVPDRKGHGLIPNPSEVNFELKQFKEYTIPANGTVEWANYTVPTGYTLYVFNIDQWFGGITLGADAQLIHYFTDILDTNPYFAKWIIYVSGVVVFTKDLNSTTAYTTPIAIPEGTELSFGFANFLGTDETITMFTSVRGILKRNGE